MRTLLIAFSLLIACDAPTPKKSPPIAKSEDEKKTDLAPTNPETVAKPAIVQPKRSAFLKATKDLKVIPFEINDLKEIEINGKLDKGFRWTDKRGDNAVLISSKSVKDGQSLYLTHYLLDDSGHAKVREIKEHNACRNYGILDIRHSALKVLDINNDGLGEFTFGYVKDCGDDRMESVPPEYKLFLLEDGEKYALRGSQKTERRWNHSKPFKSPTGVYKADPSLSKKPKLKSHLESVWASTCDILKDAKRGDLTAVLRQSGLTINRKHVNFPKEYQEDNRCSGAPDQLSIESFDSTIPAVYVNSRTCNGDEDPPNAQLIYLMVDGKPVDALTDIYFGYHYGTETVTFLGDGSITVPETDWAACSRKRKDFGIDLPKGKAAKFYHNRIMRYDSAKKKLVYTAFKKTKQKVNCGELSACPYVYVENNGAETFVGEILRYLIGKNAYALQSLPLPPTTKGTLVVRLSEEKDEKTFLDEIFIEVDGQRIYPNSCAADKASKSLFCAKDKDFYTMEKGDSHRFEFSVPESDNVVLWARGFYRPIVTKK